MGNTLSGVAAAGLDCPSWPAAACNTKLASNTQLLDAVKKGDVTAVQRMLSRRPTALLHRRLTSSNLPVHVAAKRGDTDILQLIVVEVARRAAAGAAMCRVKPVCRWDSTGAEAAVSPAGLSLHDERDNGQLCPAGSPDRTEVVLQLQHVQQQVAYAINLPNNKGLTPLMFAAHHSKVVAVELLLQQGADPWARDKRGRTALHYAALASDTRSVTAILDSLPAGDADQGSRRMVNLQTQVGFTPLLCAVAARHLPTVRALLCHTPDLLLATLLTGTRKEVVLMNDCTAVSPLHLAARNGDEHITKELLRFFAESGAGRQCDPRCRRNSWGWFPCQTALRWGHFDLALMLQPQTPLDAVTPQQLRYFGVSTLQFIAAAALRQHLLDGCDRAATGATATAVASGAAQRMGSLQEPAWSSVVASVGAAAAAALVVQPSHSLQQREGAHPTPAATTAAPIVARQQLLQGDVEVVAHSCGAMTAGPGSTTRVASDSAKSLFSTDEASVRLCVEQVEEDARGFVSGGAGGALLPTCQVSSGTIDDAGLALNAAGSAVNEAHDELDRRCPAMHVPLVQSQCEICHESCKAVLAAEPQQQRRQQQLCGVCYDAPEVVQALPCRHGLCVGCAKELALRLVKHPLPCPFCRVSVSAFGSHVTHKGP